VPQIQYRSLADAVENAGTKAYDGHSVPRLEADGANSVQPPASFGFPQLRPDNLGGETVYHKAAYAKS
jgi:hypothetical protein